MWDPFRELEDHFRRMGSGMHFDSYSNRGNGVLRSSAMGRWIPSMDLTEEPGQFTLTADLPGMKKDEMEVNVTGNKVCVRGNRADSKAMQRLSESNGWVHCNERGSGKFERCFTLPHDIVENSVKATFTDGVLEVNLEKLNKNGASSNLVDIK